MARADRNSLTARAAHSLGYKKQVVLPLRIVANNADKPMTLRADDQLRGM